MELGFISLSPTRSCGVVIKWVDLTYNLMGLQEVLAMWDKRVFEKMEDCVGKFTVAYTSKNVVDGFCGPSQ